MQNLNYKKIGYLIIIIIAYLIGDSDLPESVYKKVLNQNLNPVFKDYSNRKKDEIYFIGKYTVNRILDGDTIIVLDENYKVETVRFLAVDTLERDSKDKTEKCFALKQTDFTRDNLLNKTVYLYGDSSQTQRDKYDRLLAYVTTESKGKDYFFNNKLIETGNAKVYTANPPALLLPEFLKLEEQAKNQKINMWSAVCQ